MAGTGRKARRWAAAVAALSLFGCVKGVGDPCTQHAECLPGLACEAGKCATCGDGQACLPVDLVVKSCDASTNPLEGVTHLRMTITGDGLAPIVQVVSAGDKEASLPKVPFGTGRRVLVEGLDGPQGTAKSRGSSAPFDVKADQATSSITVFLRKVQQFSSVNGRVGADACSELGQPRAGHSATLLPDGRVLIAGGYLYDGAGAKTFLKSAELYDPKSGTFTGLGSGLTLARAGHTASVLPGGKVLLAGGSGLINGKESGLATAELYDPQTQTFKFIPMKKSRMRHSAAVLPSGVVLISGGTEDAEQRYPTDRLEFFSPNTQTFTEVNDRMSVQRGDHASIAVDGDRVLIIGGTDGNQPLNTVDVYHYMSGVFVREQGSSYTLAAARGNPLALPLDAGDGKAGVLVVGAPATGGQSPTDAWDWLPVQVGGAAVAREVQFLPTPRKEFCAAPFEGGVVVVGGRKPDGTLLQTADTYFIATDGKLTSGKGGTITSARAHAACTRLLDGTVLVTGGEGLNGSAKTISGAAEVYEPLP